MNRKVFVVLILTAALSAASAFAGQPTFSLGLSDGTIREMDLFLLNVAASDPQGHVLAYTWSITNDETNGYAFFRSWSHTTADFAVKWQSAALAGSLNGKKVTIQVVARHANQTDGSEEAVATATYTISGVNHPPIPVISGKLGTPTNRIPTGYGVCADGYDSDDPDGDTVRGDWGWGSRTGGRWKTTLGDYPPSLIGSEGGRCCFTVLDMTAPIDQNIELTLTNGLHSVKTVATCYLKPASVTVPTNSAPVITFPTNPVQVAVGATAQLIAEAEDLDGDALAYNVVFLQNGATVASSAISVTTISSTKKRVTATIPAPSAGSFDFRFTARETNTTDHKVGTGTITLVVGTGGGGGNNPGDGGPGDVTNTPDTCDATETGGPPSISVTPDPTTTKPLFKSGDSVRIAVVSSDSSQKTWMGKTVKGVASITWDVSALNSLGINPTISPATARPADLNTSDSSVTFTVPTLSAAQDVYLTVVSKDVYDCGRTFRFAIRLEPKPVTVNQPPVAKIQYKIGAAAYANAPATAVTVDTTAAVTITLSAGTSTDDSGLSNLTFGWVKQNSLTSGAVALGSTSGSSTTLQVNAHTKGTVTVTLTATDQGGLTNSTTISFNITDPAQANQAPVAKIQYKIGTGELTNAPTAAVTVETATAQTITLKGDTSTDDGGLSNLTFAWVKADAITAGGVTLSPASGTSTTIQISAHTKGTSTVTLTATDQGSLSNPTTISFNIVDPTQKPIARATAKVGNQALTGPAAEGALVKLDGSASSRPDNSKTGLTYEWTRTEGPNVTITDADKAVASFTAPAATDTATQLKFKLIVTDGTTPSDPVELTVTLSQPSFYFSQVAVGPLGTRQFRTVLLLVNRNETAATGVEVKFFGQDGNPMEVTINNAPWTGQPFDIAPLGSKKLEFIGDDLKLGWAKVNSNIKIVGLLQYQIVGEDKDLESEVGLYATEAATKFVTFYDLASETAIAVANASSQPATVKIRLIDEKTGAEVVSKNLFVKEPGQVLLAMNHRAKFINLDFLGELPLDFALGTLLIESNVPVSITVLKTRGGVVFSTLPVASMK